MIIICDMKTNTIVLEKHNNKVCPKKFKSSPIFVLHFLGSIISFLKFNFIQLNYHTLLIMSRKKEK